MQVPTHEYLRVHGQTLFPNLYLDVTWIFTLTIHTMPCLHSPLFTWAGANIVAEICISTFTIKQHSLLRIPRFHISSHSTTPPNLLHFIPLHYTSLPFSPLPFPSIVFSSLQSLSNPYHSFPFSLNPFQSLTLYSSPFYSILILSTSFYYFLLHSTPFFFTNPHIQMT